MVATFSGGLDNRETVGQTVRDPVIPLRFQFKDPDGVAVDVTSPTVRVSHEGAAILLSAFGASPDSARRYTLLPAGATGLYKLTFLPTGLPAGLYGVVAEGTWTDPDLVARTLRIEGSLGIGDISRVDAMINRVQAELMDDHPEWYRLDEDCHQWSRDQLYVYLCTAIDRVNMFPTRATRYTFDSLPIDHMAVFGAKVEALYARARLEKANEMDYSDVHTLQIRRAEFYKTLADSLYAQWKEEVTAWKKMTPPTPIGIRGQQLPFRVSRVLGLLPNFRSLFSG